MRLDYPNLIGGSPAEQIQQLRTCMVQMVDTINLFIDSQEGANDTVKRDIEAIKNELHRMSQSMDEQNQYTMKQIKGV
jgi:hypothetical protein